jgi:hypothetical protein
MKYLLVRYPQLSVVEEWNQLDLNQWSFDYQSNALPTKLWFRLGIV